MMKIILQPKLTGPLVVLSSLCTSISKRVEKINNTITASTLQYDKASFL